ITNTELRVRAQPMRNSPTLQIADQDTSIVAIGRTADTAWIQVEFNGAVGWMSRFFLSSFDDLSQLPVTDGGPQSVEPRPQERTTALDGTQVETGTLVVFATLARVNVREEPSTSAPIIGQLAEDERALVTLLSREREWGQITFRGQPGWVALFAVNILGDIRTVPLIGEPGSGAPVPVPPSGRTPEERVVVDRAQEHLGRFIGGAGNLVNILEDGVATGFITCNIRLVPLFREYRPALSDYQVYPELEGIVDQMNAAFETLNGARRPWVTACDGAFVRRVLDQYPNWLASAQAGLAQLREAQRQLAILATQ
ncbi:MAG: SH3 domain-containing protein, partial [Anaerolineales bacterium]